MTVREILDRSYRNFVPFGFWGAIAGLALAAPPKCFWSIVAIGAAQAARRGRLLEMPVLFWLGVGYQIDSFQNLAAHYWWYISSISAQWESMGKLGAL